MEEYIGSEYVKDADANANQRGNKGKIESTLRMRSRIAEEDGSSCRASRKCL
jgi:hypothetical protein